MCVVKRPTHGGFRAKKLQKTYFFIKKSWLQTSPKFPVYIKRDEIPCRHLFWHQSSHFNHCNNAYYWQAVTFSVENLENPSNETLHFYLFDFSGKIVKQAIFNENQLFLQRENTSNGVYFYQIKLGEKVVQNGKLVAVE